MGRIQSIGLRLLLVQHLADQLDEGGYLASPTVS